MTQKPTPSSTGGLITLTKTGLIHTAKNGAYSGKLASMTQGKGK